METTETTSLVAFGSDIKTISDDGETMKIGGLLVRFGTPDEHDLSPLESWRGRDYFDKETDFGFKEGKATVPVLYHHGLNKQLGNRQLTDAQLSLTEDGVWLQSELKSRDAYEGRIMQMQRMGKLQLSSGIHTKRAQREVKSTSNGETCHHVTYWPIEEASLTPTPADPRTFVMEFKSLSDVEGLENEFAEVTEVKPEPSETLAPELKSFVDHRDEALDAIDGFIRRSAEIKTLRASRPTGAPISATMRESLIEAKSRLTTLDGEIESILATDAAPTEAPIAPEDAPASREEINAAFAVFATRNALSAGFELPASQE